MILKIFQSPFTYMGRLIDQRRKNKKRRQIEEKYKNVFLMMNMDFDYYKTLIQVKNDELAKHGLEV